MPEYRAVPDDEREAYYRMRDYAFRLHEGEQEYDEEDDFPTDLSSRRGLYEDDELQCICSYYDFTANLRGEWFPLGGVSSVASPPENRRGGLVRELLVELLTEFREEGIYVSALWPFAYEFYRKLGWELVQKHTRYEFEPEALSFADADPAGEFRQVDADEYEPVNAVYEEYMAGYNLATTRDEAWWRERVFSHWRTDPYVYVWEDAGEVRGYVVYSVSMDDESEWSRSMTVHEYASLDHEARRQLLRFLYYHDSQVDEVTLPSRFDTSLLDEVDDPRAINCTVKPGVMFRLVDIAEALEMLPYPDGAEGSVTMAVDDSLLEWNDGTFALAVEDGQATVDRKTPDDPDVTVDVRTLSQIYAGYLSPSDAPTYGSLTVERDDALSLLETWFPESDVFLPEGF